MKELKVISRLMLKLMWKSESKNIKEKLSEAALQRCFCKEVFLKYAANVQEKTHAEMRFQ